MRIFPADAPNCGAQCFEGKGGGFVSFPLLLFLFQFRYLLILFTVLLVNGMPKIQLRLLSQADFAGPRGGGSGKGTTIGSLGHTDLMTLKWEGEVYWVIQTL